MGHHDPIGQRGSSRITDRGGSHWPLGSHLEQYPTVDDSDADNIRLTQDDPAMASELQSTGDLAFTCDFVTGG